MALIKKKPLFSKGVENYTVANLRNPNMFTERDLFKEYQRLRSIANKRLKRISETEFAKTTYYDTWKDKFAKPASELTKRELVYQLRDLKTFLTNEQSTVKGQRERKSRILKELERFGEFDGYDRYHDLEEFMVFAKSVLQGYLYSSDELVELWENNEDSVRTMDWNELEGYLDKWGKEQNEERNKALKRAQFWKNFGDDYNSAVYSSQNLGVFGYD